MSYPRIIQGGMGVAVSSWQLAKAVARRGELGVVSGTALDVVLVRRLQLGDEGGQIRKALDNFPLPEVADRIWQKYFVKGGKAPEAPFKSKPIATKKLSKALTELIVVANYVEVFLAKQGHSGLVGINLLEKIQLPTLPSLYGAMLAGVDYVIMGAGIPRAIPGVLDRFASGQPAELDIEVTEQRAELSPDVIKQDAKVKFDPSAFGAPELKRPKFLAVISSTLLATVLAKKGNPPPDGFVIEGATAGGHNAPPRGEVQLNEIGEPIYTEKDIPDLAKIHALGLPFWLAGSYAGRLSEALGSGAAGIQVGTAFAFCDESGIRADIRERTIERSLAGDVRVFTDPKASPTGFPFKVLQDEESVSDPDIFESRDRVCDLGYLREAYRTESGDIGFRCPAEPIEDYIAKGGDPAQAIGRKCVCNGLISTVGMPQTRKGVSEPPLITAGDDIVNISRYLKPGKRTYTANDVLDVLLATG